MTEGWRRQEALEAEALVAEWLCEQYAPVTATAIAEALGLGIRRTRRALVRMELDGRVLRLDGRVSGWVAA